MFIIGSVNVVKVDLSSEPSPQPTSNMVALVALYESMYTTITEFRAFSTFTKGSN